MKKNLEKVDHYLPCTNNMQTSPTNTEILFQNLISKIILLSKFNHHHFKNKDPKPNNLTGMTIQ